MVQEVNKLFNAMLMKEKMENEIMYIDPIKVETCYKTHEFDLTFMMKKNIVDMRFVIIVEIK